MSTEALARGRRLPEQCQVIEVRVAELRQLFNSIDPSPFNERDLDPKAEEFIVDWSKDLSAAFPLALRVHLDHAIGDDGESAVVGDAIREFFRRRAVHSRRSLRELLRRGRISLMIALAFLAGSIALGDGLASYLRDSRVAEIVREGFLIGGWVAMWRPLEVFLYDWWPIHADAHLYDRLSRMPVSIEQ
jgi:hypothetical protein